MSPPKDESGESARIVIGPRPTRGYWSIAALLIVVAVLGALGRLVPQESPGPAAGASLPPTPEPAVRLVRPFRDVLYLKTTEVAVQGTAPVGTQELDVAVMVGGGSIGEARISVDARGRFNGSVSILPPARRTSAILEVRDVGSPGALLAEASFLVEAGALILPRDPSKLRAEAGSTLVVDILVYGPVREIRGLVTSEGGILIAKESTFVGALPRGATWPRTISLSIEIPLERYGSWARLHLLALDKAGTELEHLDSNVVLLNR